MKVLISYDGSRCSEAALDDLMRAGLPKTGVACVISVAEIWLPPVNPNGGAVDETDPYIEKVLKRHREKGERALAEAQAFSKHAENRLKAILPGWQSQSYATYGSPAWEVLTKADEFQPDLIVAGSHGQSAVSRFFLGSISQKILTEAHSSVRIARGRIEIDSSPIRIIVGFDSSKGAQAAVDSVASRDWPADTEVRLVSVTDPITPTAIGRFVPPIAVSVNEINEAEKEWLEKLSSEAISRLKETGLIAGHEIHVGNPKKVLVEEAEAWGADCVFVGANAFGGRLERFLIGSTSAAVASRAHCSVEVVRRPVTSPTDISI
jgi:nucleotide-binding universal stress UspA family protein